MKTNITRGSKSAGHNDYTHETLSVKDAVIWFAITVAALCVAGTSQAEKKQVKEDTVTAKAE